MGLAVSADFPTREISEHAQAVKQGATGVPNYPWLANYLKYQQLSEIIE